MTHYMKQKSCKHSTAKKSTVKKAKATTKKEPKPFLLLSLPAELREEIYRLALWDPEGLTLVSKIKGMRRTVKRDPMPSLGSYKHCGNRRYRQDLPSAAGSHSPSKVRPPWTTLSPNLLAVSKQVRDEAIGVLYKQPITVDQPKTLHHFLACIGPTNRPQVSNITIKGWGHGRGVEKAMNLAGFALLADCKDLKRLFLDCFMERQSSPQALARYVYRECHFFFEGYGDAHGKKDAAVDILKFSDSCFSNMVVRRTAYWAEDEDLDPALRQKFDDELRTLLLKR